MPLADLGLFAFSDKSFVFLLHLKLLTLDVSQLTINLAQQLRTKYSVLFKLIDRVFYLQYLFFMSFHSLGRLNLLFVAVLQIEPQLLQLFLFYSDLWLAFLKLIHLDVKLLLLLETLCCDLLLELLCCLVQILHGLILGVYVFERFVHHSVDHELAVTEQTNFTSRSL